MSLAGCLRKQCDTGLSKGRIWSSDETWLGSRCLNLDSTEDASGEIWNRT
jgi:hypothetical protein